MKKIALFFIVSMLALEANAWSGLGHQVTIEIAKRHLTKKAQQNIAKYMPYDMTEDATWMDKHRRDEPIKYTSAWHVYNVDKKHNYDPNPRLAKGDCILALRIADYNLRHYKELSDSAVLMNIRMLIHFVGDMHCPTHSYFPGPRCFWKCTLNGKQQKTFHSLYDKMPSMIYKKRKAADVAEELDKCSKSEIKKISSGNLNDWAKSCGDNNCVIYDINPF